MSAWMKLEASLRRLKRLRETGAALQEVDAEIESAREHWAAVPLTPAGMSLEWPPDIQSLARELGFAPDTRGAGPRDPALDNGVAIAQRRREKASAIHEAIEAACSIADLQVIAAGPLITLVGTAKDEVTCEHAAAIARQLAPDALGVVNHLVVKP